VSKKSKTQFRQQQAPKTTPQAGQRPKISITVYTPSLTGQFAYSYIGTVIALQRACIMNGVGFSWGTVVGSSILPTARNRCVDRFMRSNATHLFFLDSDVGVSAEDILTLAALDVEFSAIPYSKRVVDYARAVDAVQGIKNTSPRVLSSLLATPAFNLPNQQEDVPAEYIPHGLVRAAHVATGTMLLKRSVFEKMKAAGKAPEILEGVSNGQEAKALYGDGMQGNTPMDPMSEYFSYGKDERGLFIGEDYNFCQTWREMGNDIWLKLTAKSVHVGEMSFEFDFISMSQMAEERYPEGLPTDEEIHKHNEEVYEAWSALPKSPGAAGEDAPATEA
jgi:hypothetical protein